MKFEFEIIFNYICGIDIDALWFFSPHCIADTLEIDSCKLVRRQLEKAGKATMWNNALPSCVNLGEIVNVMWSIRNGKTVRMTLPNVFYQIGKINDLAVRFNSSVMSMETDTYDISCKLINKSSMTKARRMMILCHICQLSLSAMQW